MTKLLIIFLFISFSLGNESLFQRGNDEYKLGNYTKALDFYLQIEDARLESASLYFNMGNCYFKLEKVGRAIQYYEKAKKISPLDEDTEGNLELLKGQILDKIELPDQLFIFDLYNQIKYSFSLNQFLLNVFFSFVIILIGLLIRRFFNYGLGNIFSTLGILSILFFGLFTFSRLADLNDEHGIVIVEKTTAYTNPTDDNEAFILHEGASLTIIRESQSMFEIELLDGKTGWIISHEIGKI